MAGALITVCGCAWLNAPPTTHQEAREPAAGAEHPQVVSEEGVTGESTPEDDVSKAVLHWVDRVQGAELRDKNHNPALAADRSPTTQVADFEAAVGDNKADPGGIEVLPQAAPPGSVTRPAEPLAAPTTQPIPPALAELVVRAAPDAAPAIPEPLAPQVNAPTFAHGTPTSLREFLEQSLPADEGSFRDQLDRRMLWVMAGDYERARAPLNLVTAEQQELATRFVEAWVAVRDWHLGDPSRAASAAARELDELRQALQRLSDLSLPTVKICSAVRSFGQYDALEPARLPAGTAAEFVLYCEVRDFASELRDDLYTSTFDLTTTILNRAGDSVLEIKDANIVDRCRNRRHDCFIPRLVRLPATLPPGQYVAKITLVDKLGQKVAENRALFQLVAPQ